MWKAHSAQLTEEQRTLHTFLSVLCQQALCTDDAEGCGRKDWKEIAGPDPYDKGKGCAKETSELNPVLSFEFKQWRSGNRPSSDSIFAVSAHAQDTMQMPTE
ncbi:hypothetical protein T07_2535 [Trichinella nelsoni]|uniref:Uncharacterized protein n=1 Tax=Trichinella nelsoni TaxID=6336 RepID=A0A0V0S760_9BILA|nr:hypothetical protein T07_2535 [Trichinella nelsoni]